MFSKLKSRVLPAGIVVFSVLGLSACVTAPATINGMPYSELETIGAIERNGDCAFLQEKYENEGTFMPASMKKMIASCERTARLSKSRHEKKLEDEAYERELEKERAEKQARLEKYREEEEAFEARRQAAYKKSLQIVEDRINATQVAKQLDSDISDDAVNSTMAVDPNFPLPDLKRVLACSELRFDATGANVTRDGRNLSVSFEEAVTNTGVETLTMDFRKTEKFWLMTEYRQGRLSFASDRMKSFMIAKSDAASQCNAMAVMQTFEN